MILSFFPTAEGFYDYENFKYIYQYKDHLGNVRLSFTKNSAGVLTIDKESNYYPFGLEHTGYNNLVGNLDYNYKYNGKELQETGMYDYGARMYMPDIGRWGVVDPLSEKFSSNSNYNYVGNNPILIYDPDGRDWYYTNDGKYTYNSSLNKDNSEQFFKDNNIDGAKYAFASNTMGGMNYAANGTIYDDSSAGGGKAVEDGSIHNIEEVVMMHPNAIAQKNRAEASYRLYDAEAKMFGKYAYGITVGYKFGYAGYNVSLLQNAGTGQAKILGTSSLGTELGFGITFQLTALTAYGSNADGSRNNDVFAGALGSGTEASASYIIGGSESYSTDSNNLLPSRKGTTTTGINIGPSVGGGVSRTHTTDLTPSVNRFLQFNWIRH